MNLQADLHLHTNHSDGILSVRELFKKVEKKGLSGISITDHDTVSGVLEGLKLISGFKFTLLAGSEITTHLNGKEFHLLAYGFDPFSKKLNKKLESLKKFRDERALAIVDNLKSMGIELDFGRIKKKAKGAVITRPHIASEMLDLGFVSDYKEAFLKYIGDDSPAFEAKKTFKINEAIDLIHKVGGKSVIAHPGRYVSHSELDQFREMGLDGIEVLHPSHNEYHKRFYRDYCEEYNLIATGGSDYHGSRPYDEGNFGEYKVNVNIIDKLS